MIVKYEDGDTKKTYGWIEGLFKLWGLGYSEELTLFICSDGVFEFMYNDQEVAYFDIHLEAITQSKEVFLRWMEDHPQDWFIAQAQDKVKEGFNLC